MQKSKKIIEKEYRFLIDSAKLTIKPPSQIGKFVLTSKKTINHTDFLFEREKAPLKDENIGFRIRKTASATEFTYKKFLGKKDGIVSYDEFTTRISPNLIEDFKEGLFNHKDLPILQKLQQSGSLYFLLEIHNSRTIYTYTLKHSTIELMLENIKYKNDKNTVSDSMIEIEINISANDQDETDMFVNAIKETYGSEIMDEGKNTRAERLLNER